MFGKCILQNKFFQHNKINQVFVLPHINTFPLVSHAICLNKLLSELGSPHVKDSTKMFSLKNLTLL